MLNLITNQIVPKPFLTAECVFCELKLIKYEVTLHQCFCMSNISPLFHNDEMMCASHP